MAPPRLFNRTVTTRRARLAWSVVAAFVVGTLSGVLHRAFVASSNRLGILRSDSTSATAARVGGALAVRSAGRREAEGDFSERGLLDGSVIGDAPPRRALLGAAVAVVSGAGSPRVVRAVEPKITAKCALDIRFGYDKSVPLRRLTIGLFGEEAPVMTNTFLQACSATYPGQSGREGYAQYALSTVRSVAKDRLISFADFPGGNWMLKVTSPIMGGMVNETRIPLAGPETKTAETNSLRHDVVGRVSMTKGGGTFNFLITPVADASFLDNNNVVIGQVLEGFDLLDDMNNIQTVLKGGPLNLFSGDGPGTKLAKSTPENANDYLRAPFGKIKVSKSQVLAP